MMLAYEQLVAPIAPAERDLFCVEAAETGRLFGIPAEQLPMTEAALRHYLRDQYAGGDIVVSDDARALADALFAPPLGPAVPMFRVTKLVTIGLLPEPISAQYGFEWDTRRQRAFHALVAVIRRVRRVLPALLREWPIARRAA